MQSLGENDYRELARALRERIALHVPDWTDTNDSDPGITILELLGFVTEALVARGDVISERARLAAARLATAALTLAGANGQGRDCALVRNRYFAGQLLTAQDLQVEQDYVRARLRRHNRELHGVGVVRGLQISVRPDGGGAGEQVIVQPGVAIAPDGEDIEVCAEASASLPKIGSQLFVMLSHAERLTHPTVAPDGGPVQFTRVEESFALQVEAAVGENGVALARLTRAAAGWKIDQAFSVRRAKPE
jgi:hypothetical protein